MKYPFLICACLLAGCSSQQVYDSGQGLRRNQCDRIVDAADHARCMEAADRDYDAYQRERGKADASK
ncbi:MAG: hypothetical protein KKD25_06830 [Gammaproteobacteria bacterium]|jgi:hypothetical protein|nr:hypothetical protein [Gammaproteobacteria bacterium]MBU0772308.1 hypothetical protein [Gammaproteobacteria bacterium]MBU0857919.1 hypothetical protein [Gammaproteobacteria bacterium]MBU1848435.1 hypothetical protein [Gammaproteobacteria bacterium]